MRETTQLRIINEFITSYKGREPLSRFLKKQFNSNRQLGSRDRRLIQEFIYNYFRIGKMFPDKPIETRMAIANKLCRTEPGPLQEHLLSRHPELEKMQLQVEHDKLFSYGRHLSDSIRKADFIHSFVVQPKVWMRVRKEFANEVEKELNEKNILFSKDDEEQNAWSVKQATALDQLETFSKGYFEIQDLSSQKTIRYIMPSANETWWDACAGAGGKSLMMAAYEPAVKLFCTDARESILKNLEQRFRKAGVTNFSTKMLDLASGPKPRTKNSFDGIVADVPCSGSGTWARTPEWLSFFDPKHIEKFKLIQRQIVSNVVDFIPDNKPFVYITCSVFKEENEGNTTWMSENLPLRLQTQTYLEGASKGADTMFVARFTKSSK
jgi:16S rRNA (cytosine967-C5)-methyltransferase